MMMLDHTVSFTNILRNIWAMPAHKANWTKLSMHIVAIMQRPLLVLREVGWRAWGCAKQRM